jgi:AcrR family transcriptional regulator
MSGGTGSGRGQEATRERILDAALAVFAEKGYAGATTRGIARTARVNEVTLFRRFGSKKALFAAVVAERFPLAQISQRVSADEDSPVEALLVGNAKAVLSVLRSNRHMFMMILGDMWRSPVAREAVSEHGIEKGVRLVEGVIGALMDQGRLRRGDPEVTARALRGMVQSYFLTRDLLAGAQPDPAEDDRMLTGFVRIFLDGARAEVMGIDQA